MFLSEAQVAVVFFSLFNRNSDVSRHSEICICTETLQEPELVKILSKSLQLQLALIKQEKMRAELLLILKHFTYCLFVI